MKKTGKNEQKNQLSLSKIHSIVKPIIPTEQSPEFTKNFVKFSPGIIYRCEPHGIFRIISVSSNLSRVFGFLVEEFLADPDFWANLVHPDDKENAFAKKASILQEENVETEYRIRLNSGEYVWVSDTMWAVKNDLGEVTEIDGVFSKINPTQIIKKNINEQETNFQIIFENLSAGVMLQKMNGGIFAANKAAERILGLSLEQLIGRTNLDPRWKAIHTDGSPFPGETHPSRITLQTGEQFQDVHMGVHKPDGTLNWISINTNPLIRPGDSKPYAVITSFIEITKLIEAQKRILGYFQILGGLFEGSKILVDKTTPEETAEDIVRLCVEKSGVDMAWIGQINRISKTILQTQFPKKSVFQNLSGKFWDEFFELGGFFAESVNTKKAIVIIDLMTVDIQDELKKSLLQNGYSVMAIFPIMHRNKSRGNVIAFSHDPKFFTSEMTNLFEIFTNYAASALEKTFLTDETKRRLERLHTLHSITSAISASLDLELTLNVILDEVLLQLQADASSILLLNDETQKLEYMAGKGFKTREIESSSLHISEGHAGRAAAEKRTLIFNDLASSSDINPRAELLKEEGFDSFYVTPLIMKGVVIGVLEVFQREPLQIDKEWTDFFEALAGEAALAIDNTKLFQDLQKSNHDLLSAYDSTLAGWSAALDLRDKETEGHTQRVTDQTTQLARDMGIQGDELVNIYRGALLHDIGKMGVPDEILLKPGPLTSEEWVKMKMHPGFARDLLYPIQYLRPAIDIPYCHHEKWDGTGYPRGLKGTEIPFSARIFAIVDVWDAITSERPYRHAMSRAEALQHIQENSGTHFDPAVVERFLSLI